MDKSLKWNFWIADFNGVLIQRSRRDLEKIDIRHEDYDLSISSWTDRYYWTAGQAAMISFGRDLDRYSKCFRFSGSFEIEILFQKFMPRSKSHRVLMNEIQRLYITITEAQQSGQLPERFFPAAQYVEWAENRMIDLPPKLLKGMAISEDTRRRSSDASRIEKNLQKIILALILPETGKEAVDLEPLARRIEATLTDLQKGADETGREIEVSIERQSIRKRLRDVAKLLNDEAGAHFLNVE